MNNPDSRKLIPSIACWLGLVMLLDAAHVMAADKTNSPLLTVKRIFDSGEFGGDGFSARWLEDSSGYTTFESSKESSGGRDLVRHDPKTGSKEIMVPASDFVPPGLHRRWGPMSTSGRRTSRACCSSPTRSASGARTAGAITGCWIGRVTNCSSSAAMRSLRR